MYPCYLINIIEEDTRLCQTTSRDVRASTAGVDVHFSICRSNFRVHSDKSWITEDLRTS